MQSFIGPSDLCLPPPGGLQYSVGSYLPIPSNAASLLSPVPPGHASLCVGTLPGPVGYQTTPWHPHHPAASGRGQTQALRGPGGGLLQWRVGHGVRRRLLYPCGQHIVQRAGLRGGRVLVPVLQVRQGRR